MTSLDHLSIPRQNFVKEKAFELVKGYTSPPIPILEIAEENDVNVVFDNMGSYSQVIAGFCDFKSKKLYVNAGDHINRKTFTIAHELGHWILHRDFFLAHPDDYPVLPRFQSPDSSNPYEQEANSFAAQVLVPQHLLLPVKHVPVSVLAKIFGVSRQMMEIRLKNV